MFEVKLKVGDDETDKRQTEHPADQAGRLTTQARKVSAERSPTPASRRPRTRCSREGLVVVETKSEHGDGPADRALQEMGIETVSLSKYRTGITLLATGAEDPDGPPSPRFFELN